ncbi:MAG TPA: hypothetical protein VMF70_01310 [Gemmatimonadales bacterium]|nr:hypothetical protein [Gemmatimonadales bacterium]
MFRTLLSHARVLGVVAALVAFTATCNAGEKTVAPPPSSTLTKLGGDAQTGPAGDPLPTPLAVQVADSAGHGVAGVTVTWAVTAGGGHTSARTNSTDASGAASTAWTLGTTVGANSATATVSGLAPLTFHGTAVAGPAAKLVFIAQPAGGTAGTAFSPPVQVAVRDSFGNAESGAATSVGVAITTGTGSAGATLSGTTTRTASGGTASFNDLSIDKAASGYTLTATAAGLVNGVSGSFTVAAGAPASVAQQAGDSQTAAAGAPVATAPAVVVRDALGNPKPGVTVTFTVASGGGTISGGSQTTNASGIAKVGSWTLGSAGTNTLTAAVTGSGIAGNPVTFTATATGGGGGGGGGATTLFQEDFDDANLASRGWYDTPTASGVSASAITTAQHAPGSTASLQISFAQGGTTPNPPTAARHKFTPSSTVYVRYWVKYDSNWVGSGQPYHPHEFYILSNLDGDYDGPAFNYLTAYIEHNYQNGGYAILQTQDGKNIDQSKIGVNLVGVTESRAVSGCNGTPDSTADVQVICYVNGTAYDNGKTWKSAQPVFKPNPGPGYKGDWHMVEAYFQMNSIVNGIGQLDGVAQYWIDSTLVIDKHNVLFRTGAHPTMQFQQFMMGPYIGDGSPVAQRAWIDDLVVMTARP